MKPSKDELSAGWRRGSNTEAAPFQCRVVGEGGFGGLTLGHHAQPAAEIFTAWEKEKNFQTPGGNEQDFKT